MKKKVLLLIVFVCVAIISNAQLEVKYDGSTRAGLDDFLNSRYIQLGASSTRSSGYNIAVAGKSTILSGNGGAVSCGVYGRANNPYCSMTYGVAGDLSSSCTSGAGIMGSTTDILGYLVPGKYAGYFYGNTCVNGTLTATQIHQLSDKRLKDNVFSLSESAFPTLERLLNINVVSFNYSPKMFLQNIPDSITYEEAAKNLGIDSKKRHYGVIAQELQELFPELVEEGPDGYLKVNYIELVPLLIRSIQELKTEINEIKEDNKVARQMLEENGGDSKLQRKTTTPPNYSISINGQQVGIKKSYRK